MELRIGRTTTPFVVGRLCFRWHTSQNDLKSSFDNRVFFVNFAYHSVTGIVSCRYIGPFDDIVCCHCNVLLPSGILFSQSSYNIVSADAVIGCNISLQGFIIIECSYCQLCRNWLMALLDVIPIGAAVDWCCRLRVMSMPDVVANCFIHCQCFCNLMMLLSVFLLWYAALTTAFFIGF